MRIGAYQFAVSGDIPKNLAAITAGIREAAAQEADVLIFPECALTGYPPRDIASAAEVDFDALEDAIGALKQLVSAYGIAIVVGTVEWKKDRYYNSALVLFPDGSTQSYAKRSLWGWDSENFCPGEATGIFAYKGLKFGIRICYEVRFPEYFRELYAAGADVNLVLFYDISDCADPGRYDLIRSHIRTRAAENICYTLSVNSCGGHQTAPSGFYDRSGRVVRELEAGKDGLLVCGIEDKALDFSELVRKKFIDALIRK